MNPRILVVGDACVDVFNYCECERLCPEAPVPVLDVRQTVSTPGMAGNVHRNAVSLGADAELICNTNHLDIAKTRYVDAKTNHMFIRIDSPALYPRISSSVLLETLWHRYDAVIISDYNKGFLCESDMQYIGGQASTTFLDTKKMLGAWANDIDYIKINRKEYERTRGTLTDHLQGKVIETTGEGGCLYQGEIFPVSKVEVKDLSGAGDTFIAALATNFVMTNNIKDALRFANEAATIVVQKMGVSTLTD